MGNISSYDLQLKQLRQRLVNAHTVLLDKRKNNISNFERNLRALDPRAVLNRGYSITRNSQGQIVKTSNQVAPGEIILTELAGQQKFASEVLGD